MFRSRNSSIRLRSASCKPMVPSTTRMAASVRSSTRRARCTRSSPSAPVSSMPGVSITTTGPAGSSSMAFCTGSVVVPFTSDTTDRFCPVTALTTLDFPALRRPKKPICGRSADTTSLSPMARLLRSGSHGGWSDRSPECARARSHARFRAGSFPARAQSAPCQPVWYPRKHSQPGIPPASSARSDGSS